MLKQSRQDGINESGFSFLPIWPSWISTSLITLTITLQSIVEMPNEFSVIDNYGEILYQRDWHD